MKPPGGVIEEGLRDCGAIKPKKRVSAREAAEKWAEKHTNCWNAKESVEDGFLAGFRLAKRLAKREGK